MGGKTPPMVATAAPTQENMHRGCLPGDIRGRMEIPAAIDGPVAHSTPVDSRAPDSEAMGLLPELRYRQVPWRSANSQR